MRKLLVFALSLLVLSTGSARAQTTAAQQAAAEKELREQRDELERVKREREALERDALVLRNTAHELTDEVANLDRRVEASARIVRSIERNLALITEQVETASSNLTRAETELSAKKASLQQRVVDVYKRGPMFTVEAMLSAHSFGELVARYKYLHDLTLRDQALVTRVEELRNQVVRERDRLVSLQSMLERNRTDRAREEDRLRELEREQANNLKVVQQQAKRAEDKVERLKKAEAEMLTLLATMEEARKKAATSRAPAVRAAAASSSVKTSDYGKLDWPVDGSLVYTFGKDHWKGIGIAAPAGTPVKTVSGGKVTVSRRLDTYGLTVIVDHGGGDYTVYASLKDASVKEGETIAKGDVIGTTGVSDPDMPAHLHFEIRTSGGRDAVDPVKWLRKNRG